MTSGRTVKIDADTARLGQAQIGQLVAIECDGSTVVSERAGGMLRTGSVMITELGAVPDEDDLVVCYLPGRDMVIVHRLSERAGTIHRALHANGLVFRRTPDEPVEVRGVVRVVMLYP